MENVDSSAFATMMMTHRRSESQPFSITYTMRYDTILYTRPTQSFPIRWNYSKKINNKLKQEQDILHTCEYFIWNAGQKVNKVFLSFHFVSYLVCICFFLFAIEFNKLNLGVVGCLEIWNRFHFPPARLDTCELLLKMIKFMAFTAGSGNMSQNFFFCFSSFDKIRFSCNVTKVSQGFISRIMCQRSEMMPINFHP